MPWPFFTLQGNLPTVEDEEAWPKSRNSKRRFVFLTEISKIFVVEFVLRIGKGPLRARGTVAGRNLGSWLQVERDVVHGLERVSVKCENMLFWHVVYLHGIACVTSFLGFVSSHSSASFSSSYSSCLPSSLLLFLPFLKLSCFFPNCVWQCSVWSRPYGAWGSGPWLARWFLKSRSLRCFTYLSRSRFSFGAPGLYRCDGYREGSPLWNSSFFGRARLPNNEMQLNRRCNGPQPW